MTIEGVDYAWSKPTPGALVAAGKQFAVRYLCGDPSNTKCLTAAEAKALSAAGIAIVSNWEWSSGDARKGFDAGVRYAKLARDMAAACGMPAGRPIYFSVDFALTAADVPAVREYFRGIRSVLGYLGTGVYGGYDTIARARAEKWAAWRWQTYAWSSGRWHPDTHLQQYRNGVTIGGADLDLNRAMASDYGQWAVPQPRPEPTPTITTSEEPTMMIVKKAGDATCYKVFGDGTRYIEMTQPNALAGLRSIGVNLLEVPDQASLDDVLAGAELHTPPAS